MISYSSTYKKLFIKQHYVITIEEINMLLNNSMKDENNWDQFPRKQDNN